MNDLCFLPAPELVQLIRAGKVSAVEVMREHLRQIERVNPRVNAIVTLVPERALAASGEIQELEEREPRERRRDQQEHDQAHPQHRLTMLPEVAG